MASERSSKGSWPCPALFQASLAERTTLRVGGEAEVLLEPATPEELTSAVCAARERGLALRLLGGGSNLIIEEGLHRGVTIATDRMGRVFRPDPERPEGALDQAEPTLPHLTTFDQGPKNPRLVCWAGASMPGVVRRAVKLGWSGLEGLVGVPGQVGGHVAMNAGGRWGEMFDVIESLRVIEPDGTLRDVAREECHPTYRNGQLGERIVVGCVLKLEPESKAAVEHRTRTFLLEKNAVQPVTDWTCGCVFKNPDKERSDGRSAGKLIEDCGGKALSRGDAIVSPLHGNFFVNRGKATATDVLTLVEDVRDLVAKVSGVTLEPEARVWRA